MSAKRYSQQEKENYVEEFNNSNENQTAFAKSRGIPESTFRGWLNCQNNNNISFGAIELENFNDLEFSFKCENISIELKKGFDKTILKKIMVVFIND